MGSCCFLCPGWIPLPKGIFLEQWGPQEGESLACHIKPDTGEKGGWKGLWQKLVCSVCQCQRALSMQCTIWNFIGTPMQRGVCVDSDGTKCFLCPQWQSMNLTCVWVPSTDVKHALKEKAGSLWKVKVLTFSAVGIMKEAPSSHNNCCPSIKAVIGGTFQYFGSGWEVPTYSSIKWIAEMLYLGQQASWV